MNKKEIEKTLGIFLSGNDFYEICKLEKEYITWEGHHNHKIFER